MSLFLQALEETAFSQFVRGSWWAYPTIEVLHILSLSLLFGSAVFWDLRLLGFFKTLEIQALERPVLTLARVGFALTALSGLVLFLSNPVEMVGNFSFRLKMLLLVCALLNILIFHTSRRHGNNSGAQSKTHAALSILFWTGIVAAGRWIAYV